MRGTAQDWDIDVKVLKMIPDANDYKNMSEQIVFFLSNHGTNEYENTPMQIVSCLDTPSKQ